MRGNDTKYFCVGMTLAAVALMAACSRVSVDLVGDGGRTTSVATGEHQPNPASGQRPRVLRYGRLPALHSTTKSSNRAGQRLRRILGRVPDRNKFEPTVREVD